MDARVCDMPLEKSIVNNIMKKLKALPGCNVFKVHGNEFCVGQPDLIGCINGQMFCIECKQPGKKPTKIQEIRLKEWAEAGAVVGVATCWESAKEIISEIYGGKII